jgi:hydroxymethylbilane synthase
MPVLRVATRGSVLARWQAERVIARLAGGHPKLGISGSPIEAELVIITTSGDASADTPIHAMGGTGVFVKEVQQAVLDGRADIAVHSAKDLPASASPDGLLLAAVPERANPYDALVGSTLDALPAGALIGTGSVRRRAQLAALRPDLTFAELRGNIPTRLEKAAGFDAIVVAAAALERLDLLDRAAEILSSDVMMPQVGQGSLAVECRVDDETTLERLAAIDHEEHHQELDAERAFLARLGGGCNLPCGALARSMDGDITFEGLIASPDGRIVLRAWRRGGDAEIISREVVEELLEQGGRELLDIDAETTS